MTAGFIGCGKMAKAIIASVIKTRIAGARRVRASDIDVHGLRLAARRYGFVACSTNLETARKSDVIFLAVKPYQIGAILDELAPAITARHLVISIAAGIRLSRIQSKFRKARVVRAMPNLACAVSEAMTAYSTGKNVTARDCAMVEKLLGSFGDVIKLPEPQLDAVTALSGSGPAFFTYCMIAMVDGAVREGLSRHNAKRLAAQTMLGTAKLFTDTDLDPDVLITQVATAKGTTKAGLAVLAGQHVSAALSKAIRAAAKRSRQLRNQ